MNIVYIYNKEWPSKIPGANFCTFTCDGLSKVNDKDKVTLLMSNSTNVQYRDKHYTDILTDYFFIDEYKKNLKVITLDYNKKIGKHTMFYLKAVQKIIKLNKENKIDILITRNTNFLPYLYFLKKYLNIKVFFEAQHFYLAKNLREKNNREKQYFFQKYLLPKMDGIICLQNVEKKLISNYLPNQKYCVARTGITNVYEENSPKKNKYIGYIGSLDDSKGVKDLFHAFSKINNKELKLLIVGGKTKEKVDEYKKLASKLNILDKVTITGWINRVKLNNYLKQIKIGIVPAKDTYYNRYITSPMKIFDYFSYGIPIVGNDLPTIREIVTTKGGLFYKKGDIDKLASAIDLLSSEEELYSRTSNYIFKRAKELTWTERGKKLINFFDNVK